MTDDVIPGVRDCLCVPGRYGSGTPWGLTVREKK